MGGLLSRFSESPPSEVMMVGLDATGKTTILYRLKYNDTVPTLPTVGFNVETVRPCNGVHLTIWDAGSTEKMRPLWRPHFKNVKGLLFVVDSKDLNRMNEARNELQGMLELVDTVNVPVVVLANKQDIPSSLSPSEVAERLQLSKLSGRKWAICGTCGLTGEGVVESLRTLADMIKSGK